MGFPAVLITGAIVVIPLVGWFSPAAAVAVTAFTLPFEARTTGPGGLAISASIFYLPILFLAIIARRRTDGEIVRDPMTWLLLGFLVTAFASLATAIDPFFSFRKLAEMVLGVLLFVAVAASVDFRTGLRLVAAALLLSALLAGAAAMHEYVTIAAGGEWSRLLNPFSLKKARIAGVFQHPNTFGSYLSLVLPVVLGFSLAPLRWYWRSGVLTVLAILIMGLVATGSRGATAGTTTGFLAVAVLLLLRPAFGRWRVLVPAVIIPALVVAGFTGLTYQERVWKLPLVAEDPGYVYRVKLWDAAVQIIRDRPVTGVGFQGFARIIPAYLPELARAQPLPHSHNLFLEVATGTGLAGLLWWLGWAGVLLHRLYVTTRCRDPLVAAVAVGVAGGMTGFFTSGLLDYVLWDHSLMLIFWTVMGLGMAAWRVSRPGEP